MTNLKSGKRKRPMVVLDASSMISIKGGRGGGRIVGGGVPPPPPPLKGSI